METKKELNCNLCGSIKTHWHYEKRHNETVLVCNYCGNEVKEK